MREARTEPSAQVLESVTLQRDSAHVPRDLQGTRANILNVRISAVQMASAILCESSLN